MVDCQSTESSGLEDFNEQVWQVLSERDPQAPSRHDLGQEMGARGTVVVRAADSRLGEHQVGDDSTADATGNLSGQVSGGQAPGQSPKAEQGQFPVSE